jgi:DNA recombination-dependent growth factor C
MTLREKILEQGVITEETEQKLKELENEFGVLPTGETLDEIKSMLLIKSFVSKIQ